MSIITFWSNGNEETGKTISLAAISTYMAIKHNFKILVISTSNRDNVMKNCFTARKNSRTTSFGMFSLKEEKNSAMKSGMEGLVKIAKSNKLVPDIIKNYTKVVFNNVFEILYSNSIGESEEDYSIYYPDIIQAANQYYDLVFVDLDANIEEKISQTILKSSDLIVANLNQKISCIDDFIKQKQEDPILNSRKTLMLLGRYDKWSKYTAKNISRYIKEKEIVLTVPYNSQLYDASEEAGVPDLFLNYVKNPNVDREASNAFLFAEVDRAQERILYRLTELEINKS